MMIKVKRYIECVFLFILMLSLFPGCDPNEDIIDTDENQYSTLYGSVQLDFPIDDIHVPLRCIKRADLSIAFTADSLYRKEYVTVANVSNYQGLYKFNLEPGTYYYQAAKTCICGRDTCLWGGYPGGQNGMLWTMSSFEIIRGEISFDRLKFD